MASSVASLHRSIRALACLLVLHCTCQRGPAQRIQLPMGTDARALATARHIPPLLRSLPRQGFCISSCSGAAQVPVASSCEFACFEVATVSHPLRLCGGWRILLPGRRGFRITRLPPNSSWVWAYSLARLRISLSDPVLRCSMRNTRLLAAYHLSTIHSLGVPQYIRHALYFCIAPVSRAFLARRFLGSLRTHAPVLATSCTGTTICTAKVNLCSKVCCDWGASVQVLEALLESRCHALRTTR